MKLLPIISFLLLLSACSNNQSERQGMPIETSAKYDMATSPEMMDGEAMLDESETKENNQNGNQQADLEITDRKIIKTANFRMEVKDVDLSSKKIGEMVKKRVSNCK